VVPDTDDVEVVVVVVLVDVTTVPEADN